MNSCRKTFLTALFLILFMPAAVFAANEQFRRTVQVTGEAEVKVVPDEVVISLGVETFDKDLLTAQLKNAEDVQTVLAMGRGLGIEEKHLQTDQVSIRPVYPSGGYPKRVDGYVVRKAVIITLRNVEKFETLLVKSLQAGVNYVHGIDFRTMELRKYRDQARALAIKAAREKAEDLAAELGMKIGKPVTISEGYTRWWSGYNTWWGGTGGRMMTQNVVQSAGGGGGQAQGIAPGQISVNASVNVQFEME